MSIMSQGSERFFQLVSDDSHAQGGFNLLQIQAILCAGKKLQRLNLEEEGNNIKMHPKALKSMSFELTYGLGFPECLCIPYCKLNVRFIVITIFLLVNEIISMVNSVF